MTVDYSAHAIGQSLVGPIVGGTTITLTSSGNVWSSTAAPRAVFVGGAGTLIVNTIDGSSNLTFVGVAAGTLLPVRITAVSTACTCSNVTVVW